MSYKTVFYYTIIILTTLTASAGIFLVIVGISLSPANITDPIALEAHNKQIAFGSMLLLLALLILPTLTLFKEKINPPTNAR